MSNTRKPPFSQFTFSLPSGRRTHGNLMDRAFLLAIFGITAVSPETNFKSSLLLIYNVFNENIEEHLFCPFASDPRILLSNRFYFHFSHVCARMHLRARSSPLFLAPKLSCRVYNLKYCNHSGSVDVFVSVERDTICAHGHVGDDFMVNPWLTIARWFRYVSQSFLFHNILPRIKVLFIGRVWKMRVYGNGFISDWLSHLKKW